MKICKYCKSEIDAKAKNCPNCGKKQGIPTWIIVVGVIIVIGIIAGAGGNDSTSNSGNSSSSTTQVEKFSHTVTSQYDDTFAYYIEGTVTNNRDKDYSYVQIEFICYDKDGNNLGTALDNTNNLLGKQTWKYKAMGLFNSDNKVDHCDFHEVSGW